MYAIFVQTGRVRERERDIQRVRTENKTEIERDREREGDIFRGRDVVIQYIRIILL